MNQILYTIENESEKNRMKSVMLFFAITIIIFGLIMISMGGYRMASAKIAREEAKEAATVPKIELYEEDNKLIISVNHIREIKNIIYSWNNGEEIQLSVYSENFNGNLEEEIDIPGGTNTVNVKVIDVQGKVSTASGEFTYKGTYMDLSVVDNKSIKIIVTDMIGLQSVTYQWNSGEEETAYPEEGNSQKIEIVSDIPTGLNTIKIRAVNRTNEVEEKEMSVKGITKPTIKINYNSDRTLLMLKLSDEQGIESYSYKLSTAPISEVAENGNLRTDFMDKLTVVTSQTKQGNEQQSITEELPFEQGFNYLEMTIRNIEGVEETFSGWCAK